MTSVLFQFTTQCNFLIIRYYASVMCTMEML